MDERDEPAKAVVLMDDKSRVGGLTETGKEETDSYTRILRAKTMCEVGYESQVSCWKPTCEVQDVATRGATNDGVLPGNLLPAIATCNAMSADSTGGWGWRRHA